MTKLKPEAVFDSVASIDFDYLASIGIKGIVLDSDNTLIDMQRVMPDNIKNWVYKAKELGYIVIILSNSNNKNKLDDIAKTIDVEYISFAKKPSKSRILQSNEIT